MITAFILLSSWLFNSGHCNDISSNEADHFELSPFYNAIIFSDIAEIINDIDMNFKPEMQVNSVSESDDDDVENLLSEYQHYLDKAQKQRVNYLEKTKGKNKVPLLRHEKFSKINIPKIRPFDKNRHYIASNIQTQQKKYKNPYDMFIPMSWLPEEPLTTFNKIIWNDNKMSSFPVPKLRSDNGVLSSCYCEDNTIPCKCKCKQCLIPLERLHGTYFEPSKIPNMHNPLIITSYKNSEYSNEYADKLKDDSLNVRIKVDIQLPKIDNVLEKIHKSLHSYQTAQHDNINITEIYPTTNVSLPSLNFPIPLNVFTAGLSKLYQYDYSPIHKISLHKKKKSHWGNQTKKNRSKFFTFHHSKGNFYQVPAKTEKNEKHDQIYNDTQFKITYNLTKEANSTDNISELQKQNETFSNIPLLVNISNDDNSIYIETTLNENTYYTRWEPNHTTGTPQPMRIKREDKPKNNIPAVDNNTFSDDYLLKVKGLNTLRNNKDNAKIIDNNNQHGLQDSDLLYWPKNDERKLNVTGAAKKQQLKHNISNVFNTTHITGKMFSQMNWDDIDMVASTFATVVGKYANGVVTFCSNIFCRSLKCADKTCLHRSCVPEERFRQRGHCKEISNYSDPIISKEFDPIAPSNIAYELIDTLQNKMMGQIFGKATICFNVKCITFEAMNKHFTKIKCLKKELNSIGHCKNQKKQ